MELVKDSNIGTALCSDDFAITDDRFGVTGAIYRCGVCGFMQCAQFSEVLKFYETLKDKQYEDGREQRLLQARKILRTTLDALGKCPDGLNLLDIGAGSGILVEAACSLGISAQGVEPSHWLSAVAKQRKLAVFQGILPHSEIRGPFDIITLIDVIEHVTDPLSLLRSAAALVRPGGAVVIATPDARSIAARLLGWRWWHYRIAHVGYFNRQNLELTCQRAGLRLLAVHRPAWYFTIDYLLKRVERYMPNYILPRSIGRIGQFVIPLNLRDSLLFICAPK